MIDDVGQGDAIARPAAGIVGTPNILHVIMEGPIGQVVIGKQRCLPLGLRPAEGGQVGAGKAVKVPQRVLEVGDQMLGLCIE